jgi:hypothetical protein
MHNQVVLAFTVSNNSGCSSQPVLLLVTIRVKQLQQIVTCILSCSIYYSLSLSSFFAFSL